MHSGVFDLLARQRVQFGAGPLAPVAASLGKPATPAAHRIDAPIARLGRPRRIRPLGIERRCLAPPAAKGAMAPWMRTDPRATGHVGRLVEIPEAAW